MWGFLIGVYIAVLIYPFIEEWQEGRTDKERLGRMEWITPQAADLDVE